MLSRSAVMSNVQQTKLQLSIMDVSCEDEKMIEIDVSRRGESGRVFAHMDPRMEFYTFNVLI